MKVSRLDLENPNYRELGDKPEIILAFLCHNSLIPRCGDPGGGMRFKVCLPLRMLAGTMFVAAFSACAFASGSPDRTQFGHNISIGPGEEVSDVTCFGCSVRVRGHVTSDVTTFGGNIVIEDEGQVDGDMTTLGGDVRLEKDVKVAGDVTVFGGQLHRDASATIHGDVTNFGGAGWLVVIVALPFVIFGAFVAFVVWLVRRLMRPAVPVAV